MTYEFILSERRGSVGLVTLNRPETMNRMSLAMLAEVREAIGRAMEDAALGAVLLAGAGRNFCAGTDVSGFRDRLDQRNATGTTVDQSLRDDILRGPDSWVPFLQRCPKPVVVAIQGACVGMGLTTILPADLRIAADDARFGMVFVKLGLSPELTSTALLPRMVGSARALDWCMSGRLVQASEACTAGLVREVVPANELVARALEAAEQLAALPGPAVRAIRQLLHEQPHERDTFAVLRREVETLAALYETREHRDAIAAFLSKGPPATRS